MCVCGDDSDDDNNDISNANERQRYVPCVHILLVRGKSPSYKTRLSCKLSNLTRACAAMHQTTGTERTFAYSDGYSGFFFLLIFWLPLSKQHITKNTQTHSLSRSLTFRFNSIHFFICLPFFGRWPARHHTHTHIV